MDNRLSLPIHPCMNNKTPSFNGEGRRFLIEHRNIVHLNNELVLSEKRKKQNAFRAELRIECHPTLFLFPETCFDTLRHPDQSLDCSLERTLRRLTSEAGDDR